MLDFSEKVYKKVGKAGMAGLVVGIILIVVGVAAGVISIIYGVSALQAQKHLID